MRTEAHLARTAQLTERFQQVREQTLALVAPLSPEDQLLQSMPDASPTKWHLAHTSWFFERFVLRTLPGFQPFLPESDFLWNSYYEAVGPRVPRAQRGLLSRPSLEDVHAYRRTVDEQVSAALRAELPEPLTRLVELGLQHEQQHQELILTDIKHAFSLQPLAPPWARSVPEPVAPPRPSRWHSFEGGIREVGADGAGFSFDNERPRHRVFLDAYELASRLVTAGEYLDFIRDGGYRRPELWLSDGWAAVQSQGWAAPLYWRKEDGSPQLMGPAGMRPLVLDEPVCHVSYYEADAYARWAAARLPTEEEWENAARTASIDGNLLEARHFHPRPAQQDGLAQLFGDVWEWTASAYLPYAGFAADPGVVGEYNGKFMCNQMVLRGGSCATPRSHIRASYRNFFPAATRWQFSGIRLARSRAA